MNNKPIPDASNTLLRSIKPLLYQIGCFAFVSCLFMTTSLQAQTAEWRYVTTITEGIKFYLGDHIKRLPNGNLSAWEKIVTPDQSFFVSFAEWDCEGRRRRTSQTTAYGADKTVISTVRQPLWTPVMPGSSADRLYQRVCSPATPERRVRITAPAVSLRSQPDVAAPRLGTATTGAMFRLVDNTGQGGWFNIVDETTQADYWVRSEDFLIFDSPQNRAAKTVPSAAAAPPPRSTSKPVVKRSVRRKY